MLFIPYQEDLDPAHKPEEARRIGHELEERRYDGDYLYADVSYRDDHTKAAEVYAALAQIKGFSQKINPITRSLLRSETLGDTQSIETMLEKFERLVDYFHMRCEELMQLNENGSSISDYEIDSLQGYGIYCLRYANQLRQLLNSEHKMSLEEYKILGVRKCIQHLITGENASMCLVFDALTPLHIEGTLQELEEILDAAKSEDADCIPRCRLSIERIDSKKRNEILLWQPEVDIVELAKKLQFKRTDALRYVHDNWITLDEYVRLKKQFS